MFLNLDSLRINCLLLKVYEEIDTSEVFIAAWISISSFIYFAVEFYISLQTLI
jgi:hypothetical protein